MGVDTKAAVMLLRQEFSALANADNARQMAAYMKTEMPFYGIKKPDRVPLFRRLRDTFPPESAADYKALVLALWHEPEREARYMAIALAAQHKQFIRKAALPLYKKLIREGAWWDFVDDVAIRLVGTVVREHRADVRPKVDAWADGRDLWLRRSAIICQIKHGADADEAWLFNLCRRRAHESEFFIRKAIGWALREHAKHRPAAVRRFLRTNRKHLSGLSFREAAKHLDV